MNVLEMPVSLDIESKADELDLDSLFDEQPAAATAEPSADAQPEAERPIESFLPDDSVAATPAPVVPLSAGVDLAMREVMEQIIEQNDFIRSCEGEVEDAKAELKLAKENYDKAVERLRSLCTKLEFFRKADENDAARPLLGLQDDGQPEPESTEPAADDSQPTGDEPELEQGEMSPVLESEPEAGVPVRVRVIKDIFDGDKQLAKVDDQFAIADQYEGGEVAVDHPTEGGIILEVNEFEVIEWQAQQEPMSDPKIELQKFLGCSMAQVDNFVEYGIGSIPELQDALSDGLASDSDEECLKVLTAVKGVGKKKAEKILELVKARG